MHNEANHSTDSKELLDLSSPYLSWSARSRSVHTVPFMFVRNVTNASMLLISTTEMSPNIRPFVITYRTSRFQYAYILHMITRGTTSRILCFHLLNIPTMHHKVHPFPSSYATLYLKKRIDSFWIVEIDPVMGSSSSGFRYVRTSWAIYKLSVPRCTSLVVGESSSKATNMRYPQHRIKHPSTQ